MITFYDTKRDTREPATISLTLAVMSRPIERTWSSGRTRSRAWVQAALVVVFLSLLAVSLAGVFSLVVQRDAAATATFQPCTPIPWKIDHRGSPPSADRQARQAFDVIAATSGLRFVQSDARGIVIAWRRPDDKPTHWAKDEMGRGFGSWLISDGSAKFRTGWVFVRTDNRAPVQRIMLHELGHVMGLEHSRIRGDVMSPVVTDGPARYSAADRARLRAIGARAGCRAP